MSVNKHLAMKTRPTWLQMWEIDPETEIQFISLSTMENLQDKACFLPKVKQQPHLSQTTLVGVALQIMGPSRQITTTK